MTTVLREPLVTSPPPLRAVVLQLARFEGRRMLAHPVMWVGLLSSGAFALITLIVDERPVLNQESITLAWTMAPIAAAVALVTGWAVLRAGGRTDADPPVVMPVVMNQRVGGILLGLTGPAMATLAIQLALVAWTMTRDPVTSMVWTELLVGPVCVIFAGGLAAALTRWIPHPSTPVFSVLALVGLQVLAHNLRNLGSVTVPEALAPIGGPLDFPYEVSVRPSALHLAYVAALVLVTAGIAVVGRRFVGWTVLGLGATLAVTLGTAQLAPIEQGRRVETMNRLVGDQADFTCQTHDLVTFCAMPGYAGWIDDWQALAEPVLAAAPSEAIAGLEVRQYPVNSIVFLDEEESKHWWWAELASEDYDSREVVAVGTSPPTELSQELVNQLAVALVGCDGLTQCSGGQSQVVTFLWLQVHTPGWRAYTIDDPMWGSGYTSVSSCMVAELWGRPGADDLVRANWEVLTDAGTTYQKAGAILGVSVPSGYDENGSLAGGCP